ncbi:MAG: FAD-binding oxidoreductase [Caldilineaceae bacterium]|nr:FAD-binding oxidoreductase [Caldilineaceae bacterium]
MTISTLKSARLDTLKGHIRGETLLPGDAGYDQVRKIWNGMFDRRPAIIARCESAEDVAASIAFAREHDLLISVRGGGHSFPGHSVNDGGIMIDLAAMKLIDVQPQQRIARAQPGVLWGEFDQTTHEHGLAVTGGQISHTGIAGLTLGGGIGWLMRKHGLTCDNLQAVELVTADGQSMKASAEENPELFWGVRGGGGNFGIVTEFTYRLHPLSMVLGGLIAYPLPEAATVLRTLRSYLSDTPDELTTTTFLLTTPDGHPALGIGLCYAGDPEAGQHHVEDLRKMGTVVMEQIGVMPYPAVQSMLDHVATPGNRYYVKSNFVDEISDEVIDVLIDYYGRVPSPMTAILLVQMGGAVARTDREATAYQYRDANFSFSAISGWVDPDQDDANISWTRQLWEALTPYLPAAVYINELTDEGHERVRAAYGSAYDRLARLKKQVDPANIFRMNQNIQPAD